MPTRRADPLPEDEFWQLIALLDGQPVGEPVLRLTAELERRGPRTSRAFAERLALVLFELDREALADRTIRWADAPDEPPIPLSDDSFLYLRAAVVAAGRDAVAAAIADPTSLERRPWDDGEELLYVAGDHETSVSYETGSNEAHWSPRPAYDEHGRQPVALLVKDATETVEGWEPDGTPMVMELFARWVDDEVTWQVVGDLCSAVTEGGGLPEPDLDQLVVTIRFADEPDSGTAVAPRVQDEFGGLVTEGTRTFPRATGVAWTGADVATALRALGAEVLLACLPDDHGGRPALDSWATTGRHLLSPG
ncbi:DUF4240 domain-containing protein [Klenkia sp. LSe6-5]|uniref:DUF4240 domain-containing protein n=1 Tax=Klenkia sesuvii TaxID=3103137 RepID=A0ABU8DZK2_9ACTN